MKHIYYNEEAPNHELNEFLTPRELAKAMAEIAYQKFSPDSPIWVLDAGANDGRIGTAVRAAFPLATIVGIELMVMLKAPECYDTYVHGTDFLSAERDTRNTYDLAIGNPPYTVEGDSVAEAFSLKNIQSLVPGGWSIQLLRTNFMHSMERYWEDGTKRQRPGFMQKYPPKYVYISVRRPSFYKQDVRMAQFGKANTNAHDYSVFVWERGWTGEPTIRWLDWDYEPKPAHKQLELPLA